MKRYENGQVADYGLYVTAFPPDLRFVGADGETLEGAPGRRYTRLPMPFVLLLGPVAGGIFVLAFPLLIVAALAYAGATAISRFFVEHTAYVARADYEPAAAYFKKDAKEAGTAVEPELADLEQAVEAGVEKEKEEQR